MKIMATSIVCLFIAGCSSLGTIDESVLRRIEQQNQAVELMAAQHQERRETCPPLPELPPEADRAAERLFIRTVIALYSQCATGKKP